MVIYTVKSGDSLYNIAARYGVSVASLQNDNMLTDPTRLTVGQTIVIIKPQVVYMAKPGDNAEAIANANGISLNQLFRNNPVLGGEQAVAPGTELKIKLPTPTGGDMSVNAYAYPNIDPSVLRRTLPYLTYLTIFTYGIREDGSLLPINDDPLIELAEQYGVAPVMHLSTLTERGTFSNALARRVLNDESIRKSVIDNVLQTLQRKGYVGVDVDFEYVGAENAEAYVAFLEQLRRAVSPQGYEVWVALAPKVRADQPGILYEGHNYAELGAIADRSLLMTYEWGYTFGPPMAVSPLNQVRRVVEYGISEIPPSRIFLGVPNYGYDWTLPYVAGESRAQSLGNVQAVDLAWKRQAEITYDTTAQAPTFHYFLPASGGGEAVEHEVWFEDARSVQAMLSLVPEYHLYGIGVWNIMKYFPQMWLVLNSEYTIRKINMS